VAGRIGSYAVVALVAIAYLFPLMFLLNTALKSEEDYLLNPNSLTSTPIWTNFLDAWNTGGFGQYIGNSLIYTFMGATISTVASLLLAFPVARGYIKWPKLWIGLFVFALFLPNALTTQFQLLLRLGLYDNRLGYILLLSASLGVGPILVLGYLRALPVELDEAAAIDGCGYFRYLFRFVLPLCMPVLVTVFILQAIFIWNDIIFATIFLADPGKYPINVGLFAFYGQYGTLWTLLSAATLLVAIPLIVLYLFLQRYLVSGAINGALKS
jgi:raffinose/stachyose/melibiose transport system permease protein